MLGKLLMYLREKGGSDLHIKIGNKPLIRINGELEFVEGFEKIDMNNMQMIKELLLDETKAEFFEKNKNADFSYSVPGVGRFRVNAFTQRGSVAFAIRSIEENAKTIEELGLPEVLKEIIMEKRGLILVTGATGSGKSTTIYSMIEHVNRNFVRNIITLEDPIEFLFKDKKSIISQREVPNDISSFNAALKYVLRQDPDIIFIGELRDKETIDAALKAAETGHLVISTLHTVDAAKTIDRIIDFYPVEFQKQIRYQLSSLLKGVVSQRLLRSKDGDGVVAAVEIMRDSPTIKEAMLSSEGSKNLRTHIGNGKTIYSMQTFDQSILELYQQGKIDYETALDNATVKKDIELSKRGINYESTSDLYEKFLTGER